MDDDAGARIGPERLNRNWNELLQELRVTQTGTQVLTGFLLTVPFSARFEELTSGQKNVYLVVLAGAIATTALTLAPVAYHRILFRQGERRWLVAAGDTAAKCGLLLLALTCSGVLFLVFDVVASLWAASIAGVCALVLFAVGWVGVPRLGRE